MAKTSDALAILRRRIDDDAGLRRLVEHEALNARVAQMIYDARTAAGLSQAQLAKLIGTKQPAIARLEDADYGGHSLTMLQKIAAALGVRLEVSLGAGTSKPRASKGSVKKSALVASPTAVVKKATPAAAVKRPTPAKKATPTAAANKAKATGHKAAGRSTKKAPVGSRG